MQRRNAYGRVSSRRLGCTLKSRRLQAVRSCVPRSTRLLASAGRSSKTISTPVLQAQSQEYGCRCSCCTPICQQQAAGMSMPCPRMR